MNIRFGTTLIAVKTGLPFQDSNLVQYFDMLKHGGDATVTRITDVYDTQSAVALTTRKPISAANQARLAQEITGQAPNSKVLVSEKPDFTAALIEDIAQATKKLNVTA